MKRITQIVALLMMALCTTLFAQVDGRTAFRNGVIASHSNSIWRTRSGTMPLVLHVTIFTDTNANSIRRWRVGTNGLCRFWHESLIAIQGDFRRQLSGQDMSILVQTLANLPASADQTPTNRLVLISCQQGNEWQTRRYDCDNLPQEVATLLSELEQITKRKKNPEPAGGDGKPAPGR